MPTLTATTLARNFSDYLNQVRYQGATFDIQRGSDIVARLSPASRVAGYPLSRLGELYAALPELDEAEADALLADIHGATDALLPEADAWGS
jgi:hypothetical protein